MKLRSILIFAAVAAATFALAGAYVLYAEGRGKARTSDGRVGGFQFNVRKGVNGDVVRKVGTLTLECNDPRAIGNVRIYMRELRELTVDGNLARFTGPGSIRFKTQSGQVIERAGIVTASARDNRKPTGPVEPRDRITVHFQASETDLTYSFEGNVFDGDLAVGRREGNL